MANQALVQRKLPTRRCVGCGEHFPKNTLIRVVRSPEGKSTACLVKARKAHRLEASFSMKIEDAVYDALEEKLSRENRD